ncbi:MAG: NAD(P)H-dependent glycerol-3-phosphate dehydrogenase, partial [Gammaproteobacteria bacterium]|nr:NAD(P)H-dependent glycerol-3-phosphate dehydrogenase [Gammaproteobacteria bacterium]
ILWGRELDEMRDMIEHRYNARYLPDIRFPEDLEPVEQLDELLDQTQNLLIVVPSAGFRSVMQTIKPSLNSDARIMWATKGLEDGSGKLLHEVLVEELGEATPYAVVSGPSFAREVAKGLPTAVTVASYDDDFRTEAASWLHGDTFRVYSSADVVGVELGGAVKNVLAIAAGISDGLGFGANARAAIITRGLAEIMRLGASLGAQPETLMGLSGMGDLVLTCTDDQSRNRRMGLALGRGKSVESTMREIGQAVEGVGTAKVVQLVAERSGVEMPICHQVFRTLYESHPAKAAVSELLSRNQRSE